MLGKVAGMDDQRPRPSRRAFRAAWIMARAFTPHRAWAVLAFPWTVLAVLPATVRGGLFLDATRTGMVLLTPYNLALDLLVLLPLMLPIAGIAGIAVGALLTAGSFNALPVLFALAVLVGIVALAGLWFLLPKRGTSTMPTGPETPLGRRWEIAGLAQLPGTRLTAVQTARRVLATVPPPGAVVVGTANTPALFEQYQRFGFTGGPQRRVHRTIT
jgi:hypothetical protein